MTQKMRLKSWTNGRPYGEKILPMTYLRCIKPIEQCLRILLETALLELAKDSKKRGVSIGPAVSGMPEDAKRKKKNTISKAAGRSAESDGDEPVTNINELKDADAFMTKFMALRR